MKRLSEKALRELRACLDVCRPHYEEPDTTAEEREGFQELEAFLEQQEATT